VTAVAISVLAALAAAADAPRPAEAGPPDPPRTAESLVERDAGLRWTGPEGAARLAAEAARGTPRERVAALRALGALEPGRVPPGTREAAVDAALSPDPELRAAGVAALLPLRGAGAAALVRVLGPAALAPWVPFPPPPADPVAARRAADALYDLRRAAVEREFLALWEADDGTFHGMYAPLRRHGAFGARVLAAIALDRRMAAGELLPVGPYAWLGFPRERRDRADCRGRALEAIADAGDAAARETLRGFLRKAPARELYDDFDNDPIPAALDDGLRHAIAALGDPGPLYEMMAASERNLDEGFGQSAWTAMIEKRRVASAHAVLAAAAGDAGNEEERLRHLDLAEFHLRESKSHRMGLLPSDGVDEYNFACLLARRNRDAADRADALRHLKLALGGHSITSKWLLRDGDLKSLHGEPEFQRLVRDLRAREEALEGGR
jgi:hypothetical protein